MRTLLFLLLMIATSTQGRSLDWAPIKEENFDGYLCSESNPPTVVVAGWPVPPSSMHILRDKVSGKVFLSIKLSKLLLPVQEAKDWHTPDYIFYYEKELSDIDALKTQFKVGLRLTDVFGEASTPFRIRGFDNFAYSET